MQVRALHLVALTFLTLALAFPAIAQSPAPAAPTPAPTASALPTVAAPTGGDVTQTNLAAAAGIALNANLLDQSADQSQGGGDAKCGCHGGGGTQAIGQSAWNKQDADASANAWQLWAANDNTPVRIGSPGNGGNVTQTNAALAFALAANLNALSQEANQQQ